MPLSHLSLALALVLSTASCGKEAPTPLPSSNPVPAADPVHDKLGVVVECPVCGLRFDRGESRFTSTHSGLHYFFLIEDHKKAFEDDPGAYLQE